MTAWREQQTKSGKKRIDIFVSTKHHEILKDTRNETRETYGEIIGRLLDHRGARPGFKTVTLEISENDYDRLQQEYHGDVKGHLEKHVKDNARQLILGDEGDF
jgi:hypothetical protein